MANIVFMGTPEFAVPSLERLVESDFAPSAVVTGPDRERGRGRRVSFTPIKTAALKHQIPVILQPESVKDPEFEFQIREIEPDLIVVVAFRILPRGVFSAARLGAFNLHGSLLPRYRGAAPIHRAVMAGETETGVTTFFLQEKVDTGHVISRKMMSIGPDETTGDVHDRMMHLGAELVVDTTRSILDGTVQTIEQKNEDATPAPKIFRDECMVDWGMPAPGLHNFVRGLSPSPGAWTRINDRELKLYRTRRVVAGVAASAAPGTVLSTEDGLVVSCGSGAIEIVEVQLQGKKRMPATHFLRGYALETGMVFG